MASMNPKIEALAKEWIEIDYHKPTKEAIQKLLNEGNEAELDKLLSKRLAFGTAGLRGPMGAGYNRMNHVTVFQCTQGIVAYLEKTFEPAKLKEMGVVIGYDHRQNSTGVDSEMMARVAAAVCVSKGIKVYLFGKMVATPMVPFGVKFKGCAAGMMVTASHNPKDDNGYKMYGSNGAQLCEPHDQAIADLILTNLKPWADYGTLANTVRDSALCVEDLDGISAAYYKEMGETLCYHKADNAAAKLKIVYTAMHGVGAPFCERSFATFGHNAFFPVEEQNKPDPAFPTVAYPNPEEGKGALQLSFETAARVGSPLVLANDPDADRLAVAEQKADGTWRMFSGNEIGMLLAHWLFTKASLPPAKLAVVASTVSSKMTRALAQKEGMRFEETLTGFKWICNKKFDLQQEGYQVVVAFEESIGFCCGDLVNDKDGVCAAAVFAEMANQLYAKNMTVAQHMTTLARRLPVLTEPYAATPSLYDTYGHFISRQGYVVVPDPSLTVAIFDRLRNGEYPKTCGKFAIKEVRDLTVGYDTSTPDHKTTLPASQSSQHLTFTFENGCVANLRGSGTEPKLKYYVELNGPDPAQVTATLLEMVTTIVERFLEPERNGLTWAGVE